MIRHIMPSTLALIAFSQNPAFAQGEGRRAIKAKELEGEDLSAALKERAHQNRLELIEDYEKALEDQDNQGDARA